MALDGLNPQDTFNLITFAGDTAVLFEKPVPATRENLQKAQAFLASREGGGGTEMMTAIRAALAESGSNEHIRIVCFMTDGYVGNEAEILDEGVALIADGSRHLQAIGLGLAALELDALVGLVHLLGDAARLRQARHQIGRASCRERV